MKDARKWFETQAIIFSDFLKQKEWISLQKRFSKIFFKKNAELNDIKKQPLDRSTTSSRLQTDLSA